MLCLTQKYLPGGGLLPSSLFRISDALVCVKISKGVAPKDKDLQRSGPQR